MKTMKKVAGLVFGAYFLFVGLALAQDHGKHDSGHGHGQKEEAKAENMLMGQLIKDNKVEDFTFSYRLLSMDERNKMMKGMEGMKMHGMSDSPDITNHLMLYVKSADGKYASGKIGFVITSPDGNETKTLTMGMYDGYGADVSFKNKGNYVIKTKAVIGEKTLMDEVTYEVK